MFNEKINDLVPGIETCLALPSTTNPINSNASHLNSLDKVWDLKESCDSLVNEKPYNPNKRNENKMSELLSGQQKLCCVYCQGEHFLAKCDKVTHVNAHKEILKNSSCCYSCLKTGHASKKFTKNYIY